MRVYVRAHYVFTSYLFGGIYLFMTCILTTVAYTVTLTLQLFKTLLKQNTMNTRPTSFTSMLVGTFHLTLVAKLMMSVAEINQFN